ncbi:hypothetical protein GIB67_031931 [Kingdonia uniflora]|uniref:PHD finger protein EHD3 n=1 Tax=Kingdonia uniflora TaxID=39325 RepID=A0A7J7NTU7_9MAGN|nr:hypothetical protein GIB67_031931 [Kingdonia uniflora]
MLVEKRSCCSDPGGANGTLFEEGSDGLRTYKRRKNSSSCSEGNHKDDKMGSAMSQEPLNCDKPMNKCSLQLPKDVGVSNSVNAAKEQVGVTSDGSKNEANNQENSQDVTEQCQRVFHDIITSEKFGSICQLLPGVMLDSVSQFESVNKKMSQGAYEQCPKLFSDDIDQVWRKLEKIGSEMASLARDLSGISRTLYLEQVGALAKDICGRGKHEDCVESLESDRNSKPDNAEVFGAKKVCACMHCGAKADGKNCLVCDSCEGIYHISCIDTAAEDIPSSSSWYCIKCTASGIESPHENCVVCDRLSEPKNIETNQLVIIDLEEESDLCADSVSETCRICQSGVADGKKLRLCGHDQCPNKYYHVSCLTSSELRSYGPRWYCPSCICRECLTDKDDEDIVLCDGCDHAYHIYCMEPPLTSIPRGKWFCRACDEGIQAIKKVKKAYENIERENRSAKSVDILLSAAEKLKSQEILQGSD